MASLSTMASQRPAAASMLSRVDRLDLLLGYLEDEAARHGSGGSHRSSSSTTLSPASSPRSRTAEELLLETKTKGSLIDRIAFLEDRVLKMEEERRLQQQQMSMAPRSSSESEMTPTATTASSRRRRRQSKDGKKQRGLKSIVKSCVRGKLKTMDD